MAESPSLDTEAMRAYLDALEPDARVVVARAYAEMLTTRQVPDDVWLAWHCLSLWLLEHKPFMIPNPTTEGNAKCRIQASEEK